MRAIEAGTRVGKGYYFSGRSWTLTPVAADGERLPGERGEKYLPVPLPLAFAIAPLMGALFLMFLPVIGVYLTARAVARAVVGVFRHSATEVAAAVAAPWAPGEAHLAGEPPEREQPARAAHDERLDRLQREIDAERR